MIETEFPDLDFGDSLGRGSAGEVFQVTEKSTGNRYAFKRFNSMSIDRAFLETNFRRFRAMPEHPGIVGVVRSQFDSNPYFVLMEMASGVSIGSVGDLKEPGAWGLIRQICDAMGHAHKYGVVHGNLHPGNIFLSSQDDPEDVSVSVADFGTGMIGDVHHIYLDENTYFAPPDQLECAGCRWSEGSAQRWDVYRFGVIAYSLINGELPRGKRYFKSREREIRRSGGRPVPVDPIQFAESVKAAPEYRWGKKFGLTKEMKFYRDIIDDCLSLDPAQRPVDLREVRNRFKQLDYRFSLEDAEDRVVKEKRKQKAKLIGARSVAACLGISFLLATYYLVDYLKKTYFFKNKVVELDQVVSNQKAHINVLDDRWDKTVTDLKQSREAADSFFSKMAQGTNAGGTGVASLRKEDLEKSRDYYLRTLDDLTQGNGDKLEIARSQHSLAHIELKMGLEDKAKEHFESAIKGFNELYNLRSKKGAKGVVADICLRSADCYENMSHLLPHPLSSEVLQHRAKAVENFEKVLKLTPDDTSVVLRLAATSFALGKSYDAHQHYGEAIHAYSRAADIAAKMREASPDSEALTDMIGQLQFQAALSLRLAGRTDESIDAHVASMETIDNLKGIQGFTPLQSLQLAKSYLELGELFAEKSASPEELDQLYNESLRLLTPLNTEDPTDVDVAILLCRSLNHLGTIEREDGRWTDGYRLSTRGVETLKEAVDANPDHIEGILSLAEARIVHLKFLDSEKATAKTVAMRGVETMEMALKVLDENKDIVDPVRSRLHQKLVSLFEAYGDVCKGLGQIEPATRCYANAALSISYLDSHSGFSRE